MAVERVNIRMPSALRERMRVRVQNDQYGPRGKSRWIREALVAMLEDDPQMLMVAVGDELDGVNDTRELITLPTDLKDKLETAVFRLRTRGAFTDAAEAVLLRSAIRFRLEEPRRFIAKPSSPNAADNVVGA